MKDNRRIASLADSFGLNKYDVIKELALLGIGDGETSPHTILTKDEVIAIKQHLGIEVNPFVGIWARRPIEGLMTSETHLVFESDRAWSVEPGATFYADKPPMFAYDIEYHSPYWHLTCHQNSVFRAIVVFTDGVMRIRWGGVAGKFPKSFDDPHGRLVTFDELQPDEHPELAKPPTLVERPTRVHNRMGELSFDTNSRTWAGESVFDGENVEVRIDAALESDESVFDRVADRIQLVSSQRLRELAAGKLLALHNDSWRREEGETTLEEFMECLKAVSFTAYADDSVTVYFEDGDLFYGHWVLVTIDGAGKLVDTGITG